MSRTTDLPRTAVPQGVASFLPDLAARKRDVESRVLTAFGRWGYREVVPPLFEYLDVLSQGLVPEMIERGYKLEDRQDGRLMVVSPDATAQVARLAAARQDPADRPTRYGYATNVFAHAEAHQGRPREVFQVGAELLGAGGLEADLEIITLLMTVLRDLGITGFSVAVGHSRYFRAILEALALSDEDNDTLTEAVFRKDVPAMRALLLSRGVDGAQVESITRIPLLIGGTEVFATARDLTRCKGAHDALDHLEALVSGLSERGMGEHVLVDLGEIRDLDYYTGIVFEVLVPGLGFDLGGGGRYDDLVGRFGHPMDAIGFALDVERLIEARTRCGIDDARSGVDYVVEGASADAHRLAVRLREQGLCAVAALPGERADAVLRATADGVVLVEKDRETAVSLDDLVSAKRKERRAVP
ncbi:MAG: ATP phosphoribosyltransferase regulatory subunit [Leptospirillia bacterium]